MPTIDHATTPRSVIVREITAAIRAEYPTCTSYTVASSDQDVYGYLLVSVTYTDGDDVRTDARNDISDSATRVEELDEQLFPLLADLAWGSFGDRQVDTEFEVDPTTNRMKR